MSTPYTNELLKDIRDKAVTGVDVSIQDQTTPSVIAKFNNVHASTTLAADALQYATSIVVSSPTSIVAGNYIILFNPQAKRFSFFTAISVTDSTVVLDTPLDAQYNAGTFVDAASTAMNVNGSSTPVTFGLRGLGIIPGVEITVDITTLAITCVADSPVVLSTFADITALSKGVVVRARNGSTYNILNIKSNREIAGIFDTFEVVAALNPAQGEDGFRAVLELRSTLGVVARLSAGEDLEVIIQDNLTGITALSITASGHIVEN